MYVVSMFVCSACTCVCARACPRAHACVYAYLTCMYDLMLVCARVGTYKEPDPAPRLSNEELVLKTTKPCPTGCGWQAEIHKTSVICMI